MPTAGNHSLPPEQDRQTSLVYCAEPAHSRRGRIPIRWLIACILLLGSVVNYIDRQALLILALTIQRELRLSDTDYGHIVQAFLGCYAAAHLFAGRLVDKIGPRVSEAIFMVWWSLANMLMTFAGGFTSLILLRAMLGLGEPGHYAVAAKAVGQWFPPREKGVAVGLYTMGGTLGAALAGPVIIFCPFITAGDPRSPSLGPWGSSWRGSGCLFTVLPGSHSWVGPSEHCTLAAAGLLDDPSSRPESPPLTQILR